MEQSTLVPPYIFSSQPEPRCSRDFSLSFENRNNYDIRVLRPRYVSPTIPNLLAGSGSTLHAFLDAKNSTRLRLMLRPSSAPDGATLNRVCITVRGAEIGEIHVYDTQRQKVLMHWVRLFKCFRVI